MIKIDTLYPFDKGFFGKTLTVAHSKSGAAAVKPSKSKMDSVDDLIKYFDILMAKHHKKFERTPKVDTVDFKSDNYIQNLFM